MSYYGKTDVATDLARGAEVRRDPTGRRSARCPLCSATFRVARGNALGQTAKLRGLLGEHIRSAHPEELGAPRAGDTGTAPRAREE